MALDRILSILENPIRRKILQRLSRDSNYPLQLSRDLGVSQQAIMKHLKVLEDSDFVVSYIERSNKGGPPKKVYVPRKRYCIRIDIGPSTYAADFHSYMEYDLHRNDQKGNRLTPQTQVEIKGRVTGEMKENIAGALPAFTDPVLENYRISLEKTVYMENTDNKLKELKKLVSNLNRDIEIHEMRRRKLLTIRERAFEEANELIVKTSDDQLERDILSLLVKDEISDIEVISELLDTRQIFIEKRLHILLKKMR
ncbi:MAG: helix-turn-helix domain-containing protein [Candidatus Thermoplasmatota archaeon]|nr:helix-turn-helix domain-containing protein [Candidatus Thermoplasmatota archaeon]